MLKNTTHNGGKKIQNPGVIINWFDDAEDAMSVTNQVINQNEEPDLTVQNKITIRFNKNTKDYTFTPKLGTLITKLGINKIKMTTTNPEDKRWEGEYAIYFLENNNDTFVGFYNLTMSGICTPSPFNISGRKLCKERFLPREIYDQIVTEPYIIAQSRHRKGLNEEGTAPHHDMMSCDMTDQQIIDLNPLAAVQINFGTIESLTNSWKTMATPMSVGNLYSVAMEMIDRFIASFGGTFTHQKLDEAAANHQSTNLFFDRLNNELRTALVTNPNIVKEKGLLNNTDKGLKINEIQRIDIPSPTLNDWFTGLGIMINDTWGYDVTIKSFTIDKAKRTYSATFEVQIFDHFGLDRLDIDPFEKLGFSALAGFRSWFVLQHSTRFCKKPFVTIVHLNRTINGTY